jgi:predicted phosphate transport protein (TIGR00153 family)
MAFSFFPKENKFFDLFDKQTQAILEASQFFKELTLNGNFNDVNSLRMHDYEHECDVNTHDMIDLLNRTFITPFDREDIHQLAQELDNIVDMIYSITKRINLYKINAVNQDLLQFADYIEQSVAALGKALNGLRKIKNIRPIIDSCIEVNKLENLGDQLKDAVVGKLLDSNPEPIFFIKWKEIYEGTETVLDICEDVANVIETILVKQG